MPRNAYLYRRPGGIYAVRICVPERFQLRLGKREIHISTGIKDLSVAKASSLPVIHHWKSIFLEWDGLSAASQPLLSTAPDWRSDKADAPWVSGMKSSELLEKLIEDKKPRWGEDQNLKMTSMCGMFVDLMSDPHILKINRTLLRKYRERLLSLPENIYQTRRKYPNHSTADLIKLAKKLNLNTMKERTADSYISKIGEMLNWATQEEHLKSNPAANMIKRAPRPSKEQDARDKFSKEDIEQIFKAWWFKESAPLEKEKAPIFHPHYYWLPLLGLYTGARLNEICQLYTCDITKTQDGIWTIHVNCQSRNDTEEPSKAKDKKIKTANSNRHIPVHSHLLKLGLIDYIRELESNGFTRLFPELKHDKLKGYGKAAGKWFNERYLGKELDMVRNGMKSFHSFRHTCITELFNANVPETSIAQLAGHERGQTMSAKRYRKDIIDSQLAEYVNRLDFSLSQIKAFDIAAGIRSVQRTTLKRRSTERHTKVIAPRAEPICKTGGQAV